ncbi:SRPBCC family protein [Bacillus sp. FJAT-50079]|uniref:SRPBCC family protein n=1 Tax=Bacillus sp. FJAT-50079 TaxID=2833577 RepID=UPI001BCA2821|nr:SRPBCC family protein [Bacillus sp. FJAT-50079]MBS4206963.1 SRPBCC family protein [Bacillus sp. FJAT-50079]
MKEWSKEIIIEAPIEAIWDLFDGSLEKMQLMMPQVIENKPVKITEEVVGSIYRQRYKEGKRIEEYDVETLLYLDEPNEKKLKVGFILANFFDITALYELKKIDETKTQFRYTATNKVLKWYFKPFLLFAGDKVVVSFVNRVKEVAESAK